MVGVLYVHLYDTDPSLENSRVNLFFVVSGYLITLSLLRARNRDAAGQVLNFYARRLLRLMPPLLKGYLRLGAYIGEDAVIDHQFGMTDVFLILPLEAIDSRYIRFYGAEAGRYAA